MVSITKIKNEANKKKIVLGQFYTSIEVADFMVSLSTKPKISKVLDSGCGEGVFINSLIKAGFKDIKGCDIDEGNCRIVKNKFEEKAEIVCTDYLKTDKEDKLQSRLQEITGFL